MKTTKKALIFLSAHTLIFSTAVAATQVMAQADAALPAQPVSLQETLAAALPVPAEIPYLEQVMQYEAAYGPYDRRLAEPLQAAAAALEKASDALQASQLYERALHITRINDGLYSESQIAIVESLIDSLAALEDWGAVDRQFRYLHLLYTRLYETGSAELDRGLAQISDWHVIAINNSIGGEVMEHLREANKLFRQRLALAEQYGHTDGEIVDILRRNLEITQYNLRTMSSGVNTGMLSQAGARARDQLAQTD